MKLNYNRPRVGQIHCINKFALAGTLCLLWAAGASGATFRWSATANQIYVEGGGPATLTDIKAALPDAPLDLVDATNHIWLLRANLLISDGCSLVLHGAGAAGDVNELRLLSVNSTTPCDCVVSVTADYGSLDINSTKITSWDTNTGAADMDYVTNGRAYIRVRSSLSTNGITPLESRMDITNSEICYLGTTNSESYGLVWKVEGADPNPTNNIYDEVGVYGNVVNSHLHDNYIGGYAFGASGMIWLTNELDHNTQYGVQLASQSDSLVIRGNYLHDNGNSGLLASGQCQHLTILGNLALTNAASGILLALDSDDNLVENNQCKDNGSSGISIDDSSRNVVEGNILKRNQQAGLRLTLGSADNIIQGNQSVSNVLYGFYGYIGSGTPDPGDDGRPKRNLLVGNIVNGNGTAPILLADSDTNTIATNTFTDASGKMRFQRGLGNWLDGNTIPAGLAVLTEADVTSSASTFIRNQSFIDVEEGPYSSTVFTDAGGRIYQPSEGALQTEVSASGSTLTLTPDEIGSSSDVTALDFWVSASPGGAFINQLNWTNGTSRQWSVAAGLPGQVLNFTIGDLLANTNYLILKASLPYTNFLADGTGRLQFSDIATSTNPVAYTVQILNTNLANLHFSASENKVYIETSGSATLTQIKAALPNAPLDLVDPINKVWLLSGNVLIQDGCKLILHGDAAGGDVNELRLLSVDSVTNISLTADWGSIDVDGVKVTSWDTVAGGPDTNSAAANGRAHILVRSSLSTNGVTPLESRMDITNSEICYLGGNLSDAYGVVWKVSGTDPNPANNIFDEVGVYGNVVNSHLHDNYIGAYTVGASGMGWLTNELDHNTGYGLDLVSQPYGLTIEGNNFHDNGNSGLLVSGEGGHLIINGNFARTNAGSGILLGLDSDANIVANNQCSYNADSGISIDDSSSNTVSGNVLVGNQQAGLRLTLGSADNVIQNNQSVSNAQYGFYSYIGSGTPDAGDDGRPKRNLLVGNVVHDNGAAPILLADSDDNTLATNTFTDVSGKLRFQGGVGNWLDGNTIPPGLSVFSVGDTNSSALTYVRNESFIEVGAGTNSTTTFSDAGGRIYQPDEGALLTDVSINGSTLTLTPAEIGSSSGVTARDFWVRATPGDAFVNHLDWTNGTSRQWSVTAGAGGQALSFELGGLLPNSMYYLRKAGVAVSNQLSDAAGEVFFTDIAGDTNAVTYFVDYTGDGNTPPVLPLVAKHTIPELTTLTVTNTATDAQTPGYLLTYTFLAAPSNAVISASGVITWTPIEGQAPSTNFFTTKVTDTGVPPLSATNSFIVVVTVVNHAPQLPNLPNVNVVLGTTMTVTNTATDSDIPVNILLYRLAAAPANAVISTNGVITWTPTPAQSPSTNRFVTVVTDNGVPPLSATNVFTAIVSSEPLLTLHAARNPGSNGVAISWPAPATGWTLQQTGSPGGANWVDVDPGGITVVGQENVFIITNTTGRGFFRLAHP